MNDLRAKMKPKTDTTSEWQQMYGDIKKQDQELQDAIDKALAKKNK